MRQLFHDFDANLLHGYRAELVGNEIIVSPPRPGNHQFVTMEISRQLMIQSAYEAGVSWRWGFETPFGNFIPDLTVFESVECLVGASAWSHPRGTLLLVQVTTSLRSTDRVDKRRAYAAEDIPLYLLVDQEFRETVLFSLPDAEAQDYRTVTRVPFGSDLELPAPFSFTLTGFTPPD